MINCIIKGDKLLSIFKVRLFGEYKVVKFKLVFNFLFLIDDNFVLYFFRVLIIMNISLLKGVFGGGLYLSFLNCVSFGRNGL